MIDKTIKNTKKILTAKISKKKKLYMVLERVLTAKIAV